MFPNTATDSDEFVLDCRDADDKQISDTRPESLLRLALVHNLMPAEDVRDAVRKEVESRRTTIHTLQEEIARLHSVYNLAAPINSLPPELLGMAFSHLGSRSTRKADLVSATHVCRHWRDVALHDPALWAHVGHKHPEGVKTFLQRSKALPVDVTLVTPELRPQDPGNSTKCLSPIAYFDFLIW